MKNMDTIANDSDFCLLLVFPRGHAMEVGKALADTNVRIIDLGADYRFDDTDIYEAWYKVAHTHKDAPRVYGFS